jgi:hypothetical protein
MSLALDPDEEFAEVYELYSLKFGATFSTFGFRSRPDLKDKVIPMMRSALAGDRGAITDQDLGLNYPPKALT